MIYRIIAFFSDLASILDDAHTLRAQMMRRYGWMPE